jgi:NADH pyrophosphatase NudC (nudix superfamily)
MIIALAALMVISALFLTLRISDKHLPPTESETPMKPLEEAKVRIYEALRDLQFEYRVGKLSDADYQASKQALQQELARVLQQMDELSPAGKKAVTVAAAPVVAAKANVCPHCGASFKEKLKFCGECGKSMEAAG